MSSQSTSSKDTKFSHYNIVIINWLDIERNKFQLLKFKVQSFTSNDYQLVKYKTLSVAPTTRRYLTYHAFSKRDIYKLYDILFFQHLILNFFRAI